MDAEQRIEQICARLRQIVAEELMPPSFAESAQMLCEYQKTASKYSFVGMLIRTLLHGNIDNNDPWLRTADIETILTVFLAKLTDLDEIPMHCWGYNPFAAVRAALRPIADLAQFKSDSDRAFIIRNCEFMKARRDVMSAHICNTKALHLTPIREMSEEPVPYWGTAEYRAFYDAELEKIIQLCGSSGKHTKPALHFEPPLVIRCIQCLEEGCDGQDCATVPL